MKLSEIEIFALKVSDLIIENEKENMIIIDWKSILISYGFEEIFDKYSIIYTHQSYNNPEYSPTLNKMFLEAIKKDKKNCEEMLNYLLNKIHISEAQFDYLFENKFKFIQDRRLETINKTVFISYSSKDSIDFNIINQSLETIGFKTYVAETDIDLTEESMTDILRQLNESDIFIGLLSENFKKSDYCSQELGIAIQRNMLIIPLTIDGKDSYGFIREKHAKNMMDNPNIRIPKAIVKEHTSQMLDYLISRLMDLKICYNYDLCNAHLEIMEPFFEKFNNKQINNFVVAVLTNNQLHGTNGKPYLKKFYEINKSKIKKDIIIDFKNIISMPSSW